MLSPMRQRGPALTTSIVSARPLTKAELVLLQSEGRAWKAPRLAKLTQRHHALARTIASGIAQGEAAAACGYTAQNAVILMDDPSFKNLVAFYQQSVTDGYTRAHEAMAGVMLDGVNLLQVHFEKDLDTIAEGGVPAMSPSLVADIVTKLADRTGHGVSTVTTQVNVDMAEKMRMRREQARRASEAPQIEGEMKVVNG